MNLTQPQLSALRDFFAELDYQTLYDLGPRLTCSETEAWINLYVAFGKSTDRLGQGHAEALLRGHVEEDDEGDLHWNWTEQDCLDYLAIQQANMVDEATVVAELQAIEEDTR